VHGSRTRPLPAALRGPGEADFSRRVAVGDAVLATLPRSVFRPAPRGPRHSTRLGSFRCPRPDAEGYAASAVLLGQKHPSTPGLVEITVRSRIVGDRMRQAGLLYAELSIFTQGVGLARLAGTGGSSSGPGGRPRKPRVCGLIGLGRCLDVLSSSARRTPTEPAFQARASVGLLHEGRRLPGSGAPRTERRAPDIWSIISPRCRRGRRRGCPPDRAGRRGRPWPLTLRSRPTESGHTPRPGLLVNPATIWSPPRELGEPADREAMGIHCLGTHDPRGPSTGSRGPAATATRRRRARDCGTGSTPTLPDLR